MGVQPAWEIAIAEIASRSVCRVRTRHATFAPNIPTLAPVLPSPGEAVLTCCMDLTGQWHGLVRRGGRQCNGGNGEGNRRWGVADRQRALQMNISPGHCGNTLPTLSVLGGRGSWALRVAKSMQPQLVWGAGELGLFESGPCSHRRMPNMGDVCTALLRELCDIVACFASAGQRLVLLWHCMAWQ